MKIYLIRHGETDWNHINRFQGREDIELNAAGIAQAVRCGQTLQGLGIEAVYSNPTETCTLHRGGDCCTDRVKQRRCRAVAGAGLSGDLGPFSGQLVKDKKEYFALAAGDHVEGMEPFADVQKRWSVR